MQTSTNLNQPAEIHLPFFFYHIINTFFLSKFREHTKPSADTATICLKTSVTNEEDSSQRILSLGANTEAFRIQLLVV
jgi:hypothetical protein